MKYTSHGAQDQVPGAVGSLQSIGLRSMATVTLFIVAHVGKCVPVRKLTALSLKLPSAKFPVLAHQV